MFEKKEEEKKKKKKHEAGCTGREGSGWEKSLSVGEDFKLPRKEEKLKEKKKMKPRTYPSVYRKKNQSMHSNH